MIPGIVIHHGVRIRGGISAQDDHLHEQLAVMLNLIDQSILQWVDYSKPVALSIRALSVPQFPTLHRLNLSSIGPATW